MKPATIETDEAQRHDLHLVPPSQRSRGGSLTVDVYRLHSFRVLDASGKNVGTVDWIWTDTTSGAGEFLGVRLHWLRGKAQAIPTVGATIDHASATIRVAYTAAHIGRARRFKIDRALTAREKRRICFHYELQPAALPGLISLQSSAA